MSDSPTRIFFEKAKNKIVRIWLRMRLSPLFFLYHFIGKPDIAVILGVKNIDERRLVNCLKSIREQTYSQSLVDVIFVDYDSDDVFHSPYRGLCGEYLAQYVRVDNRPVWSRANALNIGIKRSMSRYMLMADADIIFDKNYITESIKELEKDPFQVITSPMLDLPDIPLEGKGYEELKALATVRRTWTGYHPSVNAASALFYRMIRGYDEEYKMYGAEDEDLANRFRLLGLRFRSIEKRASYLHQYHQKFRGIEGTDELEKQIRINREYLVRTKSLVRNKLSWGE